MGILNSELDRERKKNAELEERLEFHEAHPATVQRRYRELEAKNARLERIEKAATSFVKAPSWDNEDELIDLEAALEAGDE